MNFCKICENMLYVKIEDDQFSEYCKNCNYKKNSEEVKSRLIIDTNYNKKENFGLHLNEYIKYDKTIPRVNNIICQNTKCTRKKEEDNKIMIIKYDNVNLKYIYQCCYCDHFWNNDKETNKN